MTDGAAVKAGDVLVELDPTTDASDETRAVFGLAQDRIDIARLQALLAGDTEAFGPDPQDKPRLVSTARRQIEAQSAEHQALLDGLDRQIAQKQAEGRGGCPDAAEAGDETSRQARQPIHLARWRSPATGSPRRTGRSRWGRAWP